MDESTAIRVEVAGLPALLVTGEVCSPEPEVGISWHSCYDCEWVGLEGDLTPEQEIECEARADDIIRAYIDVRLAREWEARLADEGERFALTNGGAW